MLPCQPAAVQVCRSAAAWATGRTIRRVGMVGRIKWDWVGGNGYKVFRRPSFGSCRLPKTDTVAIFYKGGSLFALCLYIAFCFCDTGWNFLLSVIYICRAAFDIFRRPPVFKGRLKTAAGQTFIAVPPKRPLSVLPHRRRPGVWPRRGRVRRHRRPGLGRRLR